MPNLTMLTTTKADAASLYSLSIDEIDDRLTIMQHQESTSYSPTDYLTLFDYDDDFKHQHRKSRSAMCTWSQQLTDITKLSRLAVSRSMDYLDRFIASGHERAQRALFDKREYQLASMTSLYIAIKLHEPLAIDSSLLAEISAGCYTAKEIVDMESDILQALEWRVNGPTAQEFVCHLLAMLNPEGYYYNLDTLGSFLDAATFQCELAATDYDLSMCNPSVVAVGSILKSLAAIDDEYLLSSEARRAFMIKICDMVPSLDMDQVQFVRARLQQLFCLNLNVADLSPQDDCTTTDSNSCCGDSNSTAVSSRLEKSKSAHSHASCPSPANVVECSPSDCRNGCFAKCA